MQAFSAIGRITKDPELRQTQSGVAVVRFTLAVDRQFKNANGEKETDFLSCQAWRKTAELIGQYCAKGSLVGIQGEVRTGSYEKNGQRVYTTDIMVNNVKFLDSKPSTNNGQNGAYQQQNAPSNQQQGYNQQSSYQQYEQPSAPDNSRQTVDSDDLPF